MSPDRRICLSRARARDKGIHIGPKQPNTPLREVDRRVAPAFGRPQRGPDPGRDGYKREGSQGKDRQGDPYT